MDFKKCFTFGINTSCLGTAHVPCFDVADIMLSMNVCQLYDTLNYLENIVQGVLHQVLAIESHFCVLHIAG